MDLNKIIREELLKLSEVKINTQPRISRNLLYHSTNISKLSDIQNYGLLPQFGDTVKQAYGGYYKFGDEEHEEDDYDQPQELEFDGILFFSETPLIGFSQTMQGQFKWEEVLLCIITKNDTIYHKISDYPRFTDYQGHEVNSIGYTSTYNLPIFIETNDWFSFEEQECQYLLYGEKLKYFISKYFPDIYNRYNKS